MTAFFTVAGSLLMVTLYALSSAINAARWRDNRRMWQSLLAGLLLGIATGGAIWLGVEFPNADFWDSQGLGS